MVRYLLNSGLILLGLLVMSFGAAHTVASLSEVEAGSVESALRQANLDQSEAFLVDPVIVSSSWEATPAIQAQILAPEQAAPVETQAPVEIAAASPELIEQQSTSTAAPNPTPPPAEVPVRLVIPSIKLDAPVVIAKTVIVRVAGKEYQQWLAPDSFVAGWHTGSARLGQIGNTVLNGHNNINGEVFRDLENTQPGDTILVFGQEHLYRYIVTNRMVLPEKYERLDVRMNNAQWILPSQDERLTLISCWPYESNTHRLILVAKPLGREKLAHKVQ
ncbi:MAG TPA: sortase [Anaerolineales bacterium]|nr:sortase [Anaerolineales bacterium]